MAFQVSPGVLVQEWDLTNVIPAVATTIGAVAGQFSQGPMDEVTSTSSEKELVERDRHDNPMDIVYGLTDKQWKESVVSFKELAEERKKLEGPTEHFYLLKVFAHFPLIDRHKNMPCVIAAHGPSLNLSKKKIVELQQSKKMLRFFNIISSNINR